MIPRVVVVMCTSVAGAMLTFESMWMSVPEEDIYIAVMAFWALGRKSSRSAQAEDKLIDT